MSIRTPRRPAPSGLVIRGATSRRKFPESLENLARDLSQNEAGPTRGAPGLPRVRPGGAWLRPWCRPGPLRPCSRGPSWGRVLMGPKPRTCGGCCPRNLVGAEAPECCSPPRLRLGATRLEPSPGASCPRSATRPWSAGCAVLAPFGSRPWVPFEALFGLCLPFAHPRVRGGAVLGPVRVPSSGPGRGRPWPRLPAAILGRASCPVLGAVSGRGRPWPPVGCFLRPADEESVATPSPRRKENAVFSAA